MILGGDAPIDRAVSTAGKLFQAIDVPRGTCRKINPRRKAKYCAPSLEIIRRELTFPSILPDLSRRLPDLSGRLYGRKIIPGD